MVYLPKNKYLLSSQSPIYKGALVFISAWIVSLHIKIIFINKTTNRFLIFKSNLKVIIKFLYLK